MSAGVLERADGLAADADAVRNDRAEARRARAVLGVMVVLFGIFLWFYVPRLNNFVLSDREFTGWTGPIAERLARGERPYIDFVLPIPPGSMMLLALVQKVSGKALLLQELWVAGLSHLLMGLIAYVIAAAMTSRKTALLVAATTLVLVVQTPKEIAYDHTSLLCAWLSLAAGVHALFGSPSGRRPVRWAVAGFLATFALLFKQSTAVGVIAGWAFALTYLFGAAWYERDEEARRDVVRAIAHCAGGGALGLLGVWTALVAAGSTLSAFTRAIFVDGPELKGGSLTLVKQLGAYFLLNDVLRNALVPTALLMALGVRIARRLGTLHIGDEAVKGTVLERRSAVSISASMLLVFGIAAALLVAEVHPLNRTFAATVDTFRLVPGYGFVFAVVCFVAHLMPDSRATETQHRRRGHAYNAFVLVSLTASLIYDTSFIHFTPFYYNTPEIPLALVFLFIALDRARIPGITWTVFAICLLPFFGVKFNRALSDDIPVAAGQWAGLRVNYRGEQILEAVKRVHELAAPGETVLVLPEDVELVGLVQRPRPPLLGAIVFVDQYPRRLVAHDLHALEQNLPKVIVIHPRSRAAWQLLYGTWSKNSAAQQVLEHVLDHVLPKRYRLDSSYPTIYFWDQGQMDVWVRTDDQSQRPIENEGP